MGKLFLTITVLCLLTAQGADALLKEAIGGVVTAGVAAVALPAALGVVGFTGAGITAGSYAAGMMSSAAVAGGGGVAAGGVVATLQSIGAAGLASSSYAALGAAGAAVTGALRWLK